MVLFFKTKGRTLHKLGWAEWSSRKVRGSVEVPDYQVGDKIDHAGSDCRR